MLGPQYASMPQAEHAGPARAPGPLTEKLGPRAYDGGRFNSPFADQGRTKMPFFAQPFNPMGFMKPMRRRINMIAVLECIVAPVAIFAGICWLEAFQVRNLNPHLGTLAFACGILISLVFGVKGVLVKLRQWDEEWTTPIYFRDDDPRWFLFLSVTILVATLLGGAFGEALWEDYMKGYYDLSTLGIRTEVDPITGGGEAYMDAGVISFKEGAKVDITKAIGYKDSDVYCVAPITIGDDPLAYYDFWAVGINCCSGFPKSFECFEDGRVANPTTHKAMRLMDDNARTYYRVAVEMASAEFYKTSQHPLFFTWMKDPEAKVLEMYNQGKRYFTISIVVFTVLQALAVYAMAYRQWQRRLWG